MNTRFGEKWKRIKSGFVETLREISVPLQFGTIGFSHTVIFRLPRLFSNTNTVTFFSDFYGFYLTNHGTSL